MALPITVPFVGGMPYLSHRTDPKVKGGTYSFSQLRSLWIEAGGPGGTTADIAAAIALAESGGRASVVNRIGATGLWQIHPGGRQYLDPRANARAAVAKYRGAGNKFTPWTTFTGADTPGHRKTYKDFLPKQGIPGSAIPGVDETVQGASDAASVVPRFLNSLGSAIFSKDWWIRAGLVLLGIIALAFGIYLLGREFVTSQAGGIIGSALKNK